MSLIAAFLLVQAGAAEPVEPVAQEIVVIAEKIKRWRGFASKQNGTWVCKTQRSTGDKAIDRIGCDAMIGCFVETEDEVQAIEQRGADKKVRKQLLAAFFKDRMVPCVKARRSDGIAELAERRARS